MSDVLYFEDIAENIKAILHNVGEARVRYGREHDDIKIMAVTKTVPPERVNFAVGQGFTLLGENRVQEFLQKKEYYVNNAEIQFIGHLQSNKIKYIINSVSLIQSVSSIPLAKEIGRLAVKNGRIMDILCEVNIGGEETKSGFSCTEIKQALYELSAVEGIRIKGLMTIPPVSDSPVFLEKMQRIYEDMKAEKIEGTDISILSMGMSGDYVQAIGCGTGMIRIGSALFGARNYSK